MKPDLNPPPTKKKYHPPKLSKVTLEMAQLRRLGKAGQEDKATDSFLELLFLDSEET